MLFPKKKTSFLVYGLKKWKMIKNPRSSGLNGFYLTADQIINISGLVIKV